MVRLNIPQIARTSTSTPFPQVSIAIPSQKFPETLTECHLLHRDIARGNRPGSSLGLRPPRGRFCVFQALQWSRRLLYRKTGNENVVLPYHALLRMPRRGTPHAWCRRLEAAVLRLRIRTYSGEPHRR